MLKFRTLEADEYQRLTQVAEGFVPDPGASRVVVAEDDGEIVGRMILCMPVHIEGTWVKPDHRKTTLAYRMHQFCLQTLRDLGLGKALAYANDEQTENYLSRLGYIRTHVSLWEKEV